MPHTRGRGLAPDTLMDKSAIFPFLAEPFHCDFTGRLTIGHLGNAMLNAADFHAQERGLGMSYLTSVNKTWVLSRLAIELAERPKMYEKFSIETWVEGCMRFFTNRNFRLTAADGRVLGYGRSIWAMIDTQTRQPQDILAMRDGAIRQWIDAERPCPIDKSSRVKMGAGAQLAATIDTHYSDVDINGHINSVKYIEHVLDLFPTQWHAANEIRRFEIAYVAESHGGDRLSLYTEQPAEGETNISVRHGDTECCRCKLITK